MALPAIRPRLSPPLFPPAAAAESRDGAPAEAKPLHPRVGCHALLLAPERGAVELAKTERPSSLTKPAVPPLTREAKAA